MERDLKRIQALAEEVLSIARGQLLVQFRFLDRAIHELTPAQGASREIATDGRHFYYDPLSLLRTYRRQQSWVIRAWGHAMMHCLFRHMFGCVGLDARLWDLACDIAAEGMLAELDIRQLRDAPGQAERAQVLGELSKKLHPLTAEKLYRWLLDDPPDPALEGHWRELFELDDHSPWYEVAEAAVAVASGSGSGGAQALSEGERAELQSLWRDISEHVQMDLETFAKQRGDTPGNMTQALRALNRERTSYAEFLRRFAVRAEVMRVSPDEFDYNFYTYGLSLYRDMPLIEPLEYREDKRVRELVIAIDTSGSVAGELVQRFLEKTWNIVKQQENFTRRFALHIVQCDADIQEDALVTTQEEFDRYIKAMTLRGLGGTDFRPVFEYVNALRSKGALRRMRGLLYFTDGLGVYPERMPDYQTAFIFLERDDYIRPAVPPWAMRVVLEEDEIRMNDQGA